MDPSNSILSWEELQRFALFGSALIGACIFVFGQINSIKSFVSKSIDKVLDKLEYHERHDDLRFDDIRKDMQLVHVRMAARTGKTNVDD